MQNWEIDPKTGDYIMEGGAPKQTDSLKIPAYIRLKTPRTRWLYAPDERYGSNFYLVKKRQNVRDASALENIAAVALSPIVDDLRASEVTVTATSLSRNNVGLKAEILEADGTEAELVLPSLGV